MAIWLINLADDFNKQKIVWGEMSNAPKFAIDNEGFLIDNTEYYINGNNLSYLIKFLNSKLYTWYFDKICISGMGARKWRKQYVELLYIPNQPIITFEGLNDSQIEEAIADIVGMTQEERDWIRNLELLGFEK